MALDEFDQMLTCLRLGLGSMPVGLVLRLELTVLQVLGLAKMQLTE